MILLHSRRYVLPTEPFVLLLAAFAIRTMIALLHRKREQPRSGT
jgi:hypothetical protein